MDKRQGNVVNVFHHVVVKHRGRRVRGVLEYGVEVWTGRTYERMSEKVAEKTLPRDEVDLMRALLCDYRMGAHIGEAIAKTNAQVEDVRNIVDVTIPPGVYWQNEEARDAERK